MAETRFLHIQIYNSTNTAVEYDNKIDTTWGITAGTASLERSIMETELKYGEMIANKFEVQVFGINVKLENRKIVVNLEITQPDTVNNIVDDEGNAIVTDEGDNFVFVTPETTTLALFTGIINSSKSDNTKTYRDIIAYDRFYEDRDTDISAWWNTYWGISSDGTVTGDVNTTLGAFISTLLTHVGYTFVKPVMINDSLALKSEDMNYYSALTIGDILPMLCVLQNVCPNIAGDGSFEFISLNDNIAYLNNNVEGLNSYWEDFVTEAVTGVGVYDTSSELAQLVGTNNNVYCIVGNIFLLAQSASTITTVCTNILNDLSNITYTPCEIKVGVSKPLEYNLGSKLITNNGTVYIMQDILSNSLLVDEQIISPAMGEYLSKDVDTISDNFIQGNKIAQITKDIDAFNIDYANFKQGTETQFQQTADTFVLKVKQDGTISHVKFGTSAETGSAFQIKADNIEFISSGKIQLTSKSLGIESTYFKVDTDGKITATGGTIGGFTIDTSKIYNGMTSLSDTTHDGVYVGTDGIALGKGKFKVTNAGALTATSGTIGGFTIDATKLSASSGNVGIEISSTGIIKASGVNPFTSIPMTVNLSNGWVRIHEKSNENNRYVTIGTEVSGSYKSGFVTMADSDNDSVSLGLYGVSSSVDLGLTAPDGVHAWYSYGNAHGYLYCGDVYTGDNNDTWDGTNTSLKSALDGKVSKSGSTMTGVLTSNTAHSSSWNKARDNAFIRSHGYANQGAYYGAVSMLATAGSWGMGVIGSDNKLYFTWTRNNEYTQNINNTDQYYISPVNNGSAHSYQIAHAGNVGTGDNNGQVKIAGTNVSVKGMGISYSTKTQRGFTFRYYETPYDITILVVGTGTSTCTNETVYDLTSKTNMNQDNIVEEIRAYDYTAVRGRIMYNEGKVKITITSAAYGQSVLRIPKKSL